MRPNHDDAPSLTEVCHRLADPVELLAHEPRGECAIVTCRVDFGRGAWEPRTYEFTRHAGGWTVEANLGCLHHPDWAAAVRWLCRMRPVDVEVLTTV